MPAIDQHHAAAAEESPFARHARQALRQAIIQYGWDHPVVATAERSLVALLNAGRV